MILLELYPDAVLSHAKLRVLASLLAADANKPSNIILPEDREAMIKRSFEAMALLREEVELDVSLPTFYKLRDLATELLDLPDSISTLQAVALLLEAIFLKIIIFPQLDLPSQPSTSTRYQVSTLAYDNLRPLDKPTIINLIDNTPLPTQPIFYHSPTRQKHLYLNLPQDTLDRLTQIGQSLILRVKATDYIALALDHIGQNLAQPITSTNVNEVQCDSVSNPD